MYCQKDQFVKINKTYYEFLDKAVNIKKISTNEVDNQKPTVNLIENSRTNIKNAPIMNSDLKKATKIQPYDKFTKWDPLPTFKNDIKVWNKIC